MKRKTTKATAFSELKTGLEDAIAYHRGARQLTVRDVGPKRSQRRKKAGRPPGGEPWFPRRLGRRDRPRRERSPP